MKSAFVITLILFLSSTVFGQVKYEKETRIKPEEVPEVSRNFMDRIGFTKKIKWYLEERFDDISYEAKTRHNKRLHSIEFSENGALEDVEVLIKWRNLPVDLQNKISNHLSEKHQKFSVDKIQIQYLGNEDDIISFLKDGQGKEALQINYELIVKTKTGKNLQVYEYLFSATGDFIQRSEVVFRNIDNLIY